MHLVLMKRSKVVLFSIYMTDDELMKMDNLISSIKEETRTLSVGFFYFRGSTGLNITTSPSLTLIPLNLPN